MIDFEQLKIENQTLNEKIEERLVCVCVLLVVVCVCVDIVVVCMCVYRLRATED
jgi:hypothetical protein